MERGRGSRCGIFIWHRTQSNLFCSIVAPRLIVARRAKFGNIVAVLRVGFERALCRAIGTLVVETPHANRQILVFGHLFHARVEFFALVDPVTALVAVDSEGKHHAHCREGRGTGNGGNIRKKMVSNEAHNRKY